MPESQDLCMEHASIPETLPNRVEQREDDREHGICKLSLPSFKFNWLNENRVFSRDTSVSKGKRLFSWHQRGSLRSIKVLQAKNPSQRGFRSSGWTTSTCPLRITELGQIKCFFGF